MPEIGNDFGAPYKDVWYDSADGLRLYARDYPGPESSTLLPVLCMHGLTRNSADFAWIAAHLSKARRVISVDQRGRGLSDYDSDPANYMPATYVGDMFTLLDKLALPRMLVIGTSMGGLMAMLMANAQPERFAAVVLNDIGPELDPVGLNRIKNYVGKRRQIRSWDDAVAQTREINESAFPLYTDEEWLRFTKGLYKEVDGVPELAHDAAIAQAVVQTESNAVPPNLWPLFANMASIPMLVVRGAISDLLALDCVEKMQEIAPALKVLNVPDRGHAPMLDEAPSVAAIDDFFSTVDSP
ncbi:alpha/beta hydrolase [Congregibacter brevis]|uniref:Alpha/beta hydrolase n=1 Tax=Congregibacter brevis TaxID=3081201 RepID=A0ABZ0IEP9_9GAMM|nr:alpha/beta hydrolase [Congregibacter sp. IMCC45268]